MTEQQATPTTEQTNPATTAIDRMSPLAIVQLMNAEDARVAQAVERELPQIARAIEAIASHMRTGGRLIYVGAGTSGRLGVLDASECPPTFNTAPEQVIGLIAGGPPALTRAIEGAEDNREQGRFDITRLDITQQDSIVGIAASGSTPYVLAALDHARKQGALTIGLACNAHTDLERAVDIMIAPIVGPEVITGSTRLKAGTAQKMVLNMLSSGTMILLGKTYGNLMIDVQATNQKLQRRALGLVQRIAGIDEQQATVLLQAAHGETKTAIVMGLRGVTAEVARQQIAEHGGSLRRTLEA